MRNVFNIIFIAVLFLLPGCVTGKRHMPVLKDSGNKNIHRSTNPELEMRENKKVELEEDRNRVIGRVSAYDYFYKTLDKKGRLKIFNLKENRENSFD